VQHVERMARPLVIRLAPSGRSCRRVVNEERDGRSIRIAAM